MVKLPLPVREINGLLEKLKRLTDGSPLTSFESTLPDPCFKRAGEFELVLGFENGNKIVVAVNHQHDGSASVHVHGVLGDDEGRTSLEACIAEWPAAAHQTP